MGRSCSCAAVCMLIMLGACVFDPSGLADGDAGGGPIDAPRADADPNAPDADPNAPDAKVFDAGPPPVDAGCEWPYDPLHFDPCNLGNPSPDPALVLGAAGVYTYDTNNGELTAPNASTTTPTSSTVAGARAIWIAGLDVGMNATLRVTGGVPLLVIAFGDITIAGTIDASSTFVSNGIYELGAGANATQCPATPPGPGATCLQHAGSGGGAGAFGGNGGDGALAATGRDCGELDLGISGGAGGVALVAPPATLRGGCAGRDGAQNDSGTADRGIAGPGGGAIHLSARGTLTVSGTIHAGGAGGSPGLGNRAGGGGAGSGGLIGLEATDIDVDSTAFLAANGGGGGGGSDTTAASEGQDGHPNDTVAPGGDGDPNGEGGGNGGFAVSPNGVTPIAAARGGGGGGGGVGFVLMWSPNAVAVDGTSSPPFVEP